MRKDGFEKSWGDSPPDTSVHPVPKDCEFATDAITRMKRETATADQKVYKYRELVVPFVFSNDPIDMGFVPESTLVGQDSCSIGVLRSLVVWAMF